MIAIGIVIEIYIKGTLLQISCEHLAEKISAMGFITSYIHCL